MVQKGSACMKKNMFVMVLVFFGALCSASERLDQPKKGWLARAGQMYTHLWHKRAGLTKDDIAVIEGADVHAVRVFGMRHGRYTAMTEDFWNNPQTEVVSGQCIMGLLPSGRKFSVVWGENIIRVDANSKHKSYETAVHASLCAALLQKYRAKQTHTMPRGDDDAKEDAPQNKKRKSGMTIEEA